MEVILLICVVIITVSCLSIDVSLKRANKQNEEIIKLLKRTQE